MFILVLLITLGVLILIHELGHFIAAKKFKIKVLEFGFGIPPRIIGKKIGETIYSLNWLPFGGFVRLLGEDETDENVLDDKRSFANQAISKRIAVVAAGVVMNLFLAWILFWIVIASNGFKVQLPLLLDYQFIGAQTTREEKVVIGDVSKNSPAEKEGIKPGDVVVAFNDEFITSADEFVEKTASHLGQKIKVTLSDIEGTTFRSVEVTPRVKPPEGEGAIGITLSSLTIATLHYSSLEQKLLSGPVHGINMLGYSSNIFGQLILTSVQTHDFEPVSQTVTGPIGIGFVLKEILKTAKPLVPVLNFMAIISLNLAIINILPFPGLDGGRLFFLIIEGVTKKKVHPTVEKYIHTAGLLILITMILLVTFLDVNKFIL